MATRRERVILDLEDRFTPGMAKAAASTALLNRELGSLSRDSVRTRRTVSDIDRPVSDLGRSSNSTSREVDKLSGRLRILTDVATILGPSLIPIGAIGVPAVAGLASQLGFAAVAGGTAVLAFQGVGDALKALNDYRLAPTEAHLRSLQEKMSALGPAGRDFVRELQHLRPVLQELQNVAQAGLFPGLTEGLKAMESALPRVERVIAAVSAEMGDIAADTGKSLASDRWTPFLDFIAREAPSALADMASAAGNVAHAMANLWMAFDPLNDDFSKWLVDATASLDRWSGDLSKTEGFQEFVAYIHDTGPQVADTFVAIANAALQIVEAAAPLGGPVLKGIEALANALATIADSDLGTPLFTAAAALALFNRTIAVSGALQKATFGGPALMAVKGYGASIRGVSADLKAYTAVQNTAAGRARASVAQMNAQAAAGARLSSNLRGIGKGAAVMGGLAIASTGAADKIGLTNTASLALMGTFAGPWGAAIGGAIGGVMDLSAALGESEGDVRRWEETLLAASGPNIHDQLAAVTAEIEAQKKAMSSGFGFSIGGYQIRPFKNLHDDQDRIDALKETQAELQHQIESTAGAAQGAVTVTDAYGHSIAGVGTGAHLTAAEINGLVDAMKAQREEALSAFSAETRYRQALKDAQKQAKESNAGIRGSSDEALKNRQAITELASAWNNQSDAVKNNRARFREAKSAFIETATAMGVPEAAAKRLAGRLLEIPDQRVVNIHADTGQAMSAAQALQRLLNSLHDRNIHINVTKHTNATLAEADVVGADGLTVPGPRYPYRDKVLAYLAPGEEVITNRHGEADRFRADRAAGRIPAYADGGGVAWYGRHSGGSEVDYDRLAAAVMGGRAMGFRDTRDATLQALRTALHELPIMQIPTDPSLLYGAA